MAGERRPRNLWEKDSYLNQLLSGRKTMEVPVRYCNILQMVPNEAIE